jgi:phage shock protein A
MLDDLQRLFRESVAAFRAELNRREPEDQVAELLSAMRRELVAARAALPEYAANVERSRRELAHERAQLEQCERRGRLARDAGDDATVLVAEEFAGRHRARIGVLEQKVAAAEAEHALRGREAEEMKEKYRAADANRLQLVAEIKRGHARERIRTVAADATASFDDFARMEESIGQRAAESDAFAELSVEERLREMKRRMGRE